MGGASYIAGGLESSGVSSLSSESNSSTVVPGSVASSRTVVSQLSGTRIGDDLATVDDHNAVVFPENAVPVPGSSFAAESFGVGSAFEHDMSPGVARPNAAGWDAISLGEAGEYFTVLDVAETYDFEVKGATVDVGMDITGMGPGLAVAEPDAAGPDVADCLEARLKETGKGVIHPGPTRNLKAPLSWNSVLPFNAGGSNIPGLSITSSCITNMSSPNVPG